VETLNNILQPIEKVLIPRKKKNKKGKIVENILPPVFNRGIVTLVGIKTVTTRFIPVSHEGFSNETYVDKIDLLGKKRAEFISRKLKGIERRAHMSLFREMVEKNGDKWENEFENKFGKPCTIPAPLCVTCWNCSLFGALEAGKGGTFSRIRYFDTWSLQSADECIASTTSEEGLGIGNTVNEELNKERGSESYHLYEYVKTGTKFPFITIIESPTLLDIAGYLAAVKRADVHGYGKYSANHGKFQSEFIAVAEGMPEFSILDLLENDSDGDIKNKVTSGEYKFESDSVITDNEKINLIKDKLPNLFKEYWNYL
jgi:CRISPR type I-D-associated protein Csc2